MFKPSVRHVFAGLAVALALTGCAPESEMTPLPKVREEGRLGKHEQGVSLVTGYDLSVWNSGPGNEYTQRGYIMPTWNAPSNHNPTDWLGLYKVGAANDAYLNFQHVGNKGRTKFLGNAIRLPANLPTADTYEVRYLTDNAFSTVAAHSASFKVKATPTLTCATSSWRGRDVPTAHFVNVGKSSGAMNFSFSTANVKDRVQVWTDDDQLLYDSGCVSDTVSHTINSTYPNNRVLVLTLPSCDINNSGGTDWDWLLNCNP